MKSTKRAVNRSTPRATRQKQPRRPHRARTKGASAGLFLSSAEAKPTGKAEMPQTCSAAKGRQSFAEMAGLGPSRFPPGFNGSRPRSARTTTITAGSTRATLRRRDLEKRLAVAIEKIVRWRASERAANPLAGFGCGRAHASSMPGMMETILKRRTGRTTATRRRLDRQDEEPAVSSTMAQRRSHFKCTSDVVMEKGPPASSRRRVRGIRQQA